MASTANQMEVESMRTLVQPCLANISTKASWSSNGITVAGGNGPGSALNQLHYPWSACIADDQMIYISEYSNQRIVAWTPNATSGSVVAGGNKQGTRLNQLNGPANVIIDRTNDSLIIADQGNRRIVRWPRQKGRQGTVLIEDIHCWGLAVDRRGYLYAADYQTHEVKRWREGVVDAIVVAGGNGKGSSLNQLHFPTYIVVDENFSLYVCDVGNHRVIKWAENAREGTVVAGGHGPGDRLTQLSYPAGLLVDQWETVYVADSDHHRIMRWPRDATEGTVIIGEAGKGGEINQLNGPVGLTRDRQGHLYVADNLNHRLQKFILQERNCETKN